MQASSTRLKKPLHIWLARILGVGLVLAGIGTNLSLLPEFWEKIRHQGVVQDVYHTRQPNGTAIVDFVSFEAMQKGVALGDTVLNPEADSIGEVGTPVVLQIQRGKLPVREVTFVRKLYDQTAWGGVLFDLSVETSTTLTFLGIFIPILMGAVAALLICWLKSDDWMALLTAFGLATFLPYPPGDPNAFISLYTTIAATSLILWFILFPNGRLAPRWSWVVLLLLTPGVVYYQLLQLGILTWSPRLLWLDYTNTALTFVGSIVILAVITYRYRRIFSPTERQQSKWVIIALLTGLPPVILSGLIYSYFWYSHQIEKAMAAYFINSIIGSIMVVLLILGVLFSIFRYRLYDVDIFVSRAIVYSSLTGILALVGFVTSVTLDYILRQAVGNQTGLLPAMFSALPIAALFNPVRERLQNIVDRRFKLEEMDFENTFIEFTSDLSSLFTTEELSTLLSRHAVEQLDVSYASVFLNGENGNLKHIKTTSLEEGTPEPTLDDETVKKIKSGQLAVPEGDSAQSLVVPLVVPRSRKPSLMGALVLGPRLQGLGYSTAMLKSLKKFGEEVGKSFYVAEIRGKNK